MASDPKRAPDAGAAELAAQALITEGETLTSIVPLPKL